MRCKDIRLSVIDSSFSMSFAPSIKSAGCHVSHLYVVWFMLSVFFSGLGRSGYTEKTVHTSCIRTGNCLSMSIVTFSSCIFKYYFNKHVIREICVLNSELTFTIVPWFSGFPLANDFLNLDYLVFLTSWQTELLLMCQKNTSCSHIIR